MLLANNDDNDTFIFASVEDEEDYLIDLRRALSRAIVRADLDEIHLTMEEVDDPADFLNSASRNTFNVLDTIFFALQTREPIFYVPPNSPRQHVDLRRYYEEPFATRLARFTDKYEPVVRVLIHRYGLDPWRITFSPFREIAKYADDDPVMRDALVERIIDLMPREMVLSKRGMLLPSAIVADDDDLLIARIKEHTCRTVVAVRAFHDVRDEDALRTLLREVEPSIAVHLLLDFLRNANSSCTHQPCMAMAGPYGDARVLNVRRLLGPLFRSLALTRAVPRCYITGDTLLHVASTFVAGHGHLSVATRVVSEHVPFVQHLCTLFPSEPLARNTDANATALDLWHKTWRKFDRAHLTPMHALLTGLERFALQRIEAVAMALHPRLGAQSLLGCLDADILARHLFPAASVVPARLRPTHFATIHELGATQDDYAAALSYTLITRHFLVPAQPRHTPGNTRQEYTSGFATLFYDCVDRRTPITDKLCEELAFRAFLLRKPYPFRKEFNRARRRLIRLVARSDYLDMDISFSLLIRQNHLICKMLKMRLALAGQGPFAPRSFPPTPPAFLRPWLAASPRI